MRIETIGKLLSTQAGQPLEVEFRKNLDKDPNNVKRKSVHFVILQQDCEWHFGFFLLVIQMDFLYLKHTAVRGWR